MAEKQHELPKPPKLLDQVRAQMRVRHMAKRTEEAYVRWVEEFVRFHADRAGRWQHPTNMGSREVNQFLSYLATERVVSASTQNQALSAIVFLYKHIFPQPLEIDAIRAKQPQRLPVVLTPAEVRRLLAEIPLGPVRLIAGIMYGSGLRLMEACRLRVKDVDFERKQLMVRNGKGEKDRCVPLPQRLVEGLQRTIEATLALHASDVDCGAGFVYLPYALAAKYPGAERSPN